MTDTLIIRVSAAWKVRGERAAVDLIGAARGRRTDGRTDGRRGEMEEDIG